MNISRFTILPVVVFAVTLSQCGEFSQVFTPQPQTSRDAPKTVEPINDIEPKENFTNKSESAPKATKEPKATRTSSLFKAKSGGSFSAPDVVDMPSERDPIITRQGTYYFIRAGDTLSGIASRYRIDDEQLAEINQLVDSEMLVGRRLFIPNKRNRSDYLVVTRMIKANTGSREDARDKRVVSFKWPVLGIVTSPFGWRRGRNHDGLDISAKVGTPIYAAEDGRVLFAKRFAGYGNLVVLKHAQNYFSAYAHAQSLNVGQGDKVKRGQQIAVVGMTGHSTGPHLHFEIRKGVQSVDPKPLLPANQQ